MIPTATLVIPARDLSWTAAREVNRIATPDTESHWVEEAKRLSRRELTKTIDRAKGMARRERKRRVTGQQEIGAAAGAGVGDLGKAPGSGRPPQFGQRRADVRLGERPIDRPARRAVAAQIDRQHGITRRL